MADDKPGPDHPSDEHSVDEARSALANLRALINDPKHAGDEESTPFLREAEALIAPP